MTKITATLDSNVDCATEIIRLAATKGVDVAVGSVTGRERTTPTFDPGLAEASLLPETAVFDEGLFDQALWGDSSSTECFEAVLKIISSGSFPKASKRSQLTHGQHTQLRDAIAFCAHVRAKRDIFVTNDGDFLNGGRREVLESQFLTRLLTKEEFLVQLESMDKTSAT